MYRNNQILGYKEFESKKGDKCLVVTVVKELTDRDKKFGHIGMKAEEVWIPEKLQPLFDESLVGSILKCTYDVSGRFAEVVDVDFESQECTMSVEQVELLLSYLEANNGLLVRLIQDIDFLLSALVMAFFGYIYYSFLRYFTKI